MGSDIFPQGAIWKENFDPPQEGRIDRIADKIIIFLMASGFFLWFLIYKECL